MKIRGAKMGDLGEIVKIFEDSAVLNPKDKKNKDLINYISYAIKDKDFLVLVSEINSILVGVCVCKLEDLRKTDAELVDIYVLKKYRGKGIGNKLMGEIYKVLKRKKVKNLGLYSENNGKTLSFYKKEGFQIGRLIRRCDKKIK